MAQGNNANAELLALPQTWCDPFPAYSALRPISPVRFPLLRTPTESLDAWAFLRYEDVLYALRNHEIFSSAKHPLAERSLIQRLVLIHDDPPRHLRFRKIVNRAFSSARVEAIEPWIETVAWTLIKEFHGNEVDFAERFAIPLPTTVIARLMGIPESEYKVFHQWSEAFISFTTTDIAARNRSMREMTEYFGKMAAQRRKHGAEDLISALVDAEVEGHRLEDWEVLGFCILLLVAGNETTVNLLGNIINALARRPKLWLDLRNKALPVEAIIEETLRFESPVQRLLRTTVQDVEVAGVPIAKGDVVALYYGAANRDSAAFPNPDEFDPVRDNRKHLAFGSGIHFCLGSQLARAEARIALSSLVSRFASLKPSALAVQRHVGNSTGFGFDKLPIIFNS
jgi:cytochrome P450